MKKGYFTFIIIFVALFGMSILCNGCSQRLSVNTPPKLISISKSGQYVLIEGRWKETEMTAEFKIIPRINFTQIVCDKNTMTCEEIEAFLWSPNENKIHPEALLYTQKLDYEIIEWTADGNIKAIRKPPVADDEIKISLKDNFVEKNFRETKARGSETANPDVYGHWVLE